MKPRDQRHFDALLEEVIDELPPDIRRLLEEVPVVVDDRPDRRAAEAIEPRGVRPEDLCGLYTGVPLPHRSVSHNYRPPEDIHLYREGIVAAGRALREGDADQALREQIRITLLHEIGHHFGMTEEDLEDLGYG